MIDCFFRAQFSNAWSTPNVVRHLASSVSYTFVYFLSTYFIFLPSPLQFFFAKSRVSRKRNFQDRNSVNEFVLFPDSHSFIRVDNSYFISFPVNRLGNLENLVGMELRQRRTYLRRRLRNVVLFSGNIAGGRGRNNHFKRQRLIAGTLYNNCTKPSAEFLKARVRTLLIRLRRHRFSRRRLIESVFAHKGVVLL